MRSIIIILLLPVCTACAQAQTGNSVLYQTVSKTQQYYVDIKSPVAQVYEMGSYFDKAGSGYSIRSEDTLNEVQDGSFNGHRSKVIREGDRLYLITGPGQAKKLRLQPVPDINKAYDQLKNAYFLDRFIEMSNALDKKYPLYHNLFRFGFYGWENLPGKAMDYIQFQAYADNYINHFRDSISLQQDAHTRLMNYLLQNIATLGYPIFKDSLQGLPAEYQNQSAYYTTVVKETARQKPNWYFQLAEDFPENRSLIFAAAQYDKALVKQLKNTPGHDSIKKAFIKDYRFGRSMPYKLLGTYAAVGGLIALLIVSQ